MAGYEHRASYAHANVEVQERFDGSILLTHEGRTIAVRPAAPEPATSGLGAADGPTTFRKLTRSGNDANATAGAGGG